MSRDNTTAGHVDLGQSFLISEANDVVIDKITIKLGSLGYGTAVAGADYHFELWTTSAAMDWTGDTLMTSQAGTLPGTISPGDFWAFDIDDIILANAQYYAFLLAFDAGPLTERYVCFANRYGAPDYPYGRMMGRTGTPTAWEMHPHDLEFYVQGIVIPEPTTLLLLGSGLAGLLFMRRRQPG